MPVKQTLQGGKVPVQVWTDDIDSATKQQLLNVAQLPIVHHHVAAMPDVHLGKGATVGSVIATRDAIVPAAVGVDIGCFAGDTRIPLLNGTQRSLEALTKETEPFWVYSIGADGNITPGKARALKTRADAELVIVTVSGGEEIICTPDHKFMLSTGDYVEARDLSFNTSLMPLYRRWQTRDGYESCSNGKGSRLTHEMVYERLFGAIPDGFVIHHRDHLHFNNSPENLRLMESGEHSAHHRRTGRTFQNDCPAFQAKRLAAIARRASDPVKRAKMAAVGKANITAFMKNRRKEFLQSIAGNGTRGAPHLKRFNTSPRTCSDCGTEHPNPAALRWHKHRAHSYNHKVMSVRPAGYRTDVYCLAVEEHHNFALAAGVFVHNCGMRAARTTLTANDVDEKALTATYHQILRDVPVGFEQHDPDRAHAGRAGRFERGLRRILERHPELQKRVGRHSDWRRQLGTLGGGNHFIEVCLDESGRVWVMLHSGSRGIGNAIGMHFIELARRDMGRLDAQLPDRDLAYLTEGTVHFDDYVEAVGWAQDYARENRAVMLDLVLDALRRHLPPFEVTREAVDCHHNYVQRERHFGNEVWVTRKGAIRAGVGELGIIPGSMGTKSYVVRGKGNPESFHSSAHGAGRRLSRHAAKRQYGEKDLREQTEGIVCRKDPGVVDEIPAAYKDIDTVMAQQHDLVEVVHTLRQLACVKG